MFWKIIWCGKLGSGHSLKALNNLLMFNSKYLLRGNSNSIKFGIKKIFNKRNRSSNNW